MRTAAIGAETSQQRGKRIVDQTLAALGGSNFLTMQNRIASGRAYSFYREQLSGLSIAKIYTRYLPKPQPPVAGFFGVRERQAFGKKEDSAVLFDDEQGFEITFRGARPLPDAQIQRYRETTLNDFFYILRMRLGEPNLTFESRGEDVIENQPVQVVDIFDDQNRQVTVYINSDTHLPVRQRFYRRDPVNRDRIEEITRFSKYRDAGGGVMWPMDLQRERDTEKIFEMYAESVTINNKLSDSLFTLPSNMKVLKKEER
jgi:hypothetical protein